ncbi:FMN-binding protein [Streptomyces sp. NRRL WC-3742]|uniref:FMN-binding protein n=1 Tax=Streptomyces sp. NRRL WC-3742 TaxID=1463934 RepID=UPI0004C8B1AE|nr:FMN-binding protein [Streptomyces sp. NRRL WC-3742]
MRRVVVTTAATAAGVVLLLSLKPHAGAGGAATRPISSDAGPQPTTPAGPGSTATPAAPGSTTSPTTTTRTVTGDAADTRYGPVQVKVTLAGTRITRIDVVRYPSESGRDRSINSYALPQLNQEAITAQSAEIDVVSGASYTSDGYTRSLQSALDKARG